MFEKKLVVKTQWANSNTFFISIDTYVKIKHMLFFTKWKYIGTTKYNEWEDVFSYMWQRDLIGSDKVLIEVYPKI